MKKTKDDDNDGEVSEKLIEQIEEMGIEEEPDIPCPSCVAQNISELIDEWHLEDVILYIACRRLKENMGKPFLEYIHYIMLDVAQKSDEEFMEKLDELFEQYYES